MKFTSKTEARGAGETLTTLVIATAAGAVAVWAREQADLFMSNLATQKTRAQTIAARPAGELPGERIVSKVEHAAGQKLSEGAHATAGQIVQYALATAPVIGYALLRQKLPGRGVVRGAAFGEFMFVAQDQLLNTFTGLNGKPGDYPWTAHVQGFVAHAVYGAVAELALNLLESPREFEKKARAPHASSSQ